MIRSQRGKFIVEDSSYSQRRHSTSPIVIVLIIALIGVVAVFGAAAIAVAEPVAGARSGSDASASFGPEAATSGELLYRPAETQSWTTAATLSGSARFEVHGLLASVMVEQIFRNDSADWVEAVYVFPLPDSAAVNHLEITVGERRIVGEIKEKQEAKRIYKSAKTSGKRAALVTQQRPNIFTTRVANIPPGQEVVVKLDYHQAVTYDAGKFSIRFPMTITPRYIPGTPLNSAEIPATLELDSHGWAIPTTEVPDAHEITPYQNPKAGSVAAPVNKITLSGVIDMGMPLQSIQSLSHELDLRREQHRYTFELVDSGVSMDRDFVLSWRVPTGREPRAAVFRENMAGDDYAMLLFVPPNSAVQEILSRRLILVIDTSGSMGGVSIEQARASLDYALGQLRPEDEFNVVAFNSSPTALFSRAVPASRKAVARAQAFVRGLQANGGTEMRSALNLALQQAAEQVDSESKHRVSQVLFVTDGAVGNEDGLFTQLERMLGDTRLFTVGIGSAPNSWFMRKAAEIGRGSHLHIGAVSDVDMKMRELFDKLSSTLTTGLEVSWPDDIMVESFPRRIPDLHAGEPVMQLVKLGGQRAPGSMEVGLQGKLKGADWTQQLRFPEHFKKQTSALGVASLWGQAKVEHLLDVQRRSGSKDSRRQQILAVALQHRILSPYTAFVAVEAQAVRNQSTPVKMVRVLGARPAGQLSQQYAYPATATRSQMSFVLGLLLLFIAVILRRFRHVSQ